MKLKYILPLIFAVSATSLYAETKPISSSVDSRIQKVAYNPEQITKLEIAPLVSTLIKFGEGEKITHISVGDPSIFMATEIKSSPSSLKVQATSDAKVQANMTVMTNKHTYFFILSTDPGVPQEKKAISLQFTYPLDELDRQNKNHDLASEERQITTSINGARLDPENYNWNYTYFGNTNILPQQVYDDGDFTYFMLRDKQSMPSFYKVNINGDLTTLDHQMRGKYVVIHEVAPQFYLKVGDEGVNIFNKKLIPAALKNKA